eukprot:jgi/Botrbrau1/17318/Bobra.0015s0066.1
MHGPLRRGIGCEQGARQSHCRRWWRAYLRTAGHWPPTQDLRWTFLTQMEHPHTQLPYYGLHPCQTAARMALLLSAPDEGEIGAPALCLGSPPPGKPEDDDPGSAKSSETWSSDPHGPPMCTASRTGTAWSCCEAVPTTALRVEGPPSPPRCREPKSSTGSPCAALYRSSESQRTWHRWPHHCTLRVAGQGAGSWYRGYCCVPLM